MGKILRRIIAFPFVFGIILIAAIVLILKGTWQYCKNGGEFIAYDGDDGKMILDIYSELKKQRKEEQNRQLFYANNVEFTDPAYAKLIEELKNKQKEQD